MSGGLLREAYLFFYFRFVFAPSLEAPIALSGLCYLAAHPSAWGAVVLGCTLIGSLALANGLLFRSGIDQKARVRAFLDEFRGARLERLPASDFEALFDLDFMIPSVIRPRRLIDYFRRERCRIYFVEKAGAAQIFPSPRAFVSPLSQDIYVFVRDRRPDAANSAAHFRLAHELGHGAAFLSATLKRNLLGVKVVLASIAWILLISPFGPTLALWTAAELLLCARLAAFEFAGFRRDEAFFAEVAADYMAVRHLPAGSAADLLGRATPLFGRDPDLTDEQNRLREAAYRTTLSDVAEGRAFDIPRLYMDHCFKPPPALVALTFVHWAYVAYFSWTAQVSAGAAAAVALLPLLYFLLQATRDGAARGALLARLEPA